MAASNVFTLAASGVAIFQDLRCEEPSDFWSAENLRTCARCDDVLPVTSTIIVNDRDTARDIGIEIGSEVCVICHGG